MPVQMMIEREGYKKFRLSDLNLNITGNGSSSGRLAPSGIHEERVVISVVERSTGEANFYIISDGNTSVVLPKKLPNGKEFQPAIHTIARMVFYAIPVPPDYRRDLSSGNVVKLNTRRYTFDAAISAAKLAEKYGAGGKVSVYHESEPALLDEEISICRIMQRLIAR